MGYIKSVWAKWKKFTQKMALWQARFILTVFYYTLLLPFSVVITYFLDLLKIKHQYLSSWLIKSKQPLTIGEFKEQY